MKLTKSGLSLRFNALRHLLSAELCQNKNMAEYRTRIIYIAVELLEKMQRKEEVFHEYSLELELISHGTTSSYNGAYSFA